MKIIKVDNLARGGVSQGHDDELIASGIADWKEAVVMCEALNNEFSYEGAPHYYRVESDAYELRVFKP